MYCTNNNYGCGISKVITSLQPYNQKLGPDTWYYVKRCFLSLLENMAKHKIIIKDTVNEQCIEFLEQCEGTARCSRLLH